MTNRKTESQNRTKARDDEGQSRVKARDAEDQGRTKARDSEGEGRTKTRDSEVQSRVKARDAEDQGRTKARDSEGEGRTKTRDSEGQSRVKARDAEDQGRTKARDSEGESRKKPAAADTEAETAPVYLALVHYPVYNKNGEEITTTITNLDLHDISRAGRTYNIAGYYVVNHLKSQQALVQRMRKYWTGGKGAEFNQNRHDAFAVLRIADFLEDVTAEISAEQGQKPLMVTTSAKSYDHTSPVSFRQLRSEIQNSDRPCLILFGTGWGLSENLIADCDYLLEPVRGRGDFNHLSVRSAASIILDRLLAPAWWQQD